VWDKIEMELNQKDDKPSKIKNLFLLIVGGLLIFGMGILWVKESKKTKSFPSEKIALQDNTFDEMEYFYQTALYKKEKQIVSYNVSPSIQKEIEELDRGYVELKEDFLGTSSNNKSMMLHLMKENYELKIKIIELAIERSSIKNLNKKI
jgi:hypothetical protein